jgi:hypothetical protein
MVDVADLARISALYEERNTLKQAIQTFDGGGIILSMTVGSPMPPPIPPEPPPEPPTGPPTEPLPPPPPPPVFLPMVMINTQNMTYPPQMVAGIKQQLQARLTEIATELESLGITGAVEITPVRP